MRHVIAFALGIITCCFCVGQSIEPQVIGSTGDYFVGTNATLSNTVGEVMIETVSSTNSMITQGFQQPETSGVGIVEAGKKIEVNVFPNPTFDKLNITLKDADQDFSVQLYDVQGKLVRQLTYTQNASAVHMDISHYAAGNYVLKVSSKNAQHIASFKVQKMK